MKPKYEPQIIRRPRKQYSANEALFMSHVFKELQCSSDDATTSLINGLFKRVHRLHNFYELDCNRPLTTAERKSIENCEADIELMLKTLGFKRWIFNTDPRGYAVKVQFPSKVYNTWGGEEDGFGI